MHTRTVLAVAALAGGLVFVPAAMQQANAAHGFGGGGLGGGGFGGGGHFGGGMSGAHFGGGPHFAAGGGRLGGPMGSPRVAGSQWRGGPGWNGGHAVWHANEWRGHAHDRLVHDHFHDRFNNRFVAVGLGGWWPGYYGYGYGNCSWLYDQALYTGSPYWWNRYYACANYY
jgi:hypothetical protein